MFMEIIFLFNDKLRIEKALQQNAKGLENGQAPPLKFNIAIFLTFTPFII